MGKIIKKSLKFLIIFAGILIMFPTLLYFALQIPAVQTGIVKRVTAHFSTQLQSTISIGRIEYRFFNRLYLSNLLIKDKNDDTLLYARKLTAGVRRLDFKGKNFRLGRVNLTDPVFALITDSTGQMNLNWFLDHLRKNPADTTTTQPSNISVDRIDLGNAAFALINRKPDTISQNRIKKIKPDKRINFNNLRLDSINGIIEDLGIRNDSVNLTVYELAFRERGGMRVDRMSGSFMISGPELLFRSVFIHTNTSILNLPELRMRGDSIEAFDDFTNKVRLDILLDNSIIGAADLAYFAPLPEDFNEVVTLSGRISGTVSELRGRDIMMNYGRYTSLDCNFDLSGLPEIEDTYIYVGVNKLQTNARDFENFRIPGKKKFEVPEVLYKLGNITFDGSFTGFTTDFVTYGEFITQLGELRTDISLRPDKSNVYLMKGLLNGSQINLGSLTDSKVLGKLNIKANVDGSASSFKSFAGNLKGTIDSVEINSYTYRNIDLNGIFTDKTWDGSINVIDKNIKMDLLGMLNFKDSLPEFDFTLNLAHADLHNLNIDQKDTVSSVSALITSNFKGNSIDNLDGEIKLLNSTIKRNNKTIDLYDFSIRTYNENSSPVLSLRTDFVNADIRGKYNFAGLTSMVSSSLAAIMPSLFRPERKKVNTGTNNFTFEVNFRNTSEVSEFLNAGIVLSDKSYIRGSVSPDTVINIQARAPFLNVKNIIFNNFAFDAKSDESVLNADMVTSSLVLPGKTELKDFRFTFKTNPDNFIFNVDWDNKQSILERGNIRARGNVSESSAGSGNPVLKVNIDSTVVYTRNQPWQISQSSITIDTNAIKVGRIHIASEDRFYDIIGAVSHDPSDTLYLKFRGIDISPLNYLIQKSDSAALPLDLKGIINGGISMTNVYKDLLLQGSLFINKFSILGSDYGDISLNAGFNNAKKVVEISAGNNLGGKRMFDVNGYYDPEMKYINLDAVAHQLPVEALNPLLKSFASGIKGTTSGKVKLSGATNNLELTGAVKAENVSIKIDYLQTVYKLNDSVNFDSEGFRFNNVRFTDTEGHLATINGLVSHRNFKDYQADLTINMNNDFMVLNTTLANNPTFYGRVYGSGVTKIKIQPNLLSFDIVAKTGKNSRLSIPLNSSLSVSEYPFVSFVSASELKENTGAKPAAQPSTIGLNINIDLNVTPEAVVELIFDPKVGDIMSGSGSGMLNITLNPKGDFAILGDYTLEQGSYLFTLGNILNKKFEVENGGKIIFNGNLDDAEIDLRTKYKKFNTSLFPIIQEQQYAQEKVAVEPQLILTGKLFNPTVNFEINLPNANEQAKAYLRNGISSDEEMSRQFLYLLVTQSFYSETSSATSGTSNPTGSSAVAATTFEMVSNQLSNWISQINENFNLGLSYKPGSGDRALNPDELNVAFETQVLDDRVLINGNFDYKTNSTIAESATRLTGDFDASVRITDRLRFKVFNRFNDTFLGIRGPYTQGIGIFYRQEFGRLSDLFRKKGNMKKEEEPAVIVNK